MMTQNLEEPQTGAGGGVAAEAASAPRIHLVWTRAIDGVASCGRIKVAQGVRAAFQAAGFSVTESVIRPLTSAPTISRLMAAAGGLVRWMAKGKLMPLQCLLFGDPSEARRVLAELPRDCDLVYLDGVRCLAVLQAVRRHSPHLAIVTDLDDLMSRRMALLLELDQPPSTGYLKSSMPGFVDRLLSSRRLSRLLLWYEATSLRQVEKHIAKVSDAAVLISREDAAMMRTLSSGADVRSIPIAAKVARQGPEFGSGRLRFVFVGSDSLRQNQLTIDSLLDLWRRERIPTPLVVYGEQQRVQQLPPNVSMPGYAEDIQEIYDGRSILLSPSYLAGGLKSKVLEAFAFGTPVIGNSITFEAIEIGPDYPLLIEREEEMLPLLVEPERFLDRFERAAALGLDMVREHYDPDRVEAAWRATAFTAMARAKISDRNGRSSQASSDLGEFVKRSVASLNGTPDRGLKQPGTLKNE